MIAGGLLALWLCDSARWWAIGALAGWLMGARIHAYSHVSEGRAASGHELFVHVGADAGLGLVVGILILGVIAAVDSLVSRYSSRDQAV